MALVPLILTTSQLAYAEEAPVSEALDETEVIEVTGFRGSATRQLNNKRFSDNITDGIFAEDMGKMPDENIAEAMQRITGVGIDNVDGEGSSITIRGVEASFNNVQLNGVTLTNGGDDNSVDLSGMSADMLRSIEVIKTPSANHDEGSLGGTVRLNTWKPLDLKKERIQLGVQTKYNDLSGDTDYKISASLGKNFLNDKLGVTAAFNYDKRASRLDKQTNYGWSYKNTTATDYLTGEEYGRISSFEPTGVEKNIQLIDRLRYGVTTTIQYSPSSNNSVWLDLAYTRQEKDSLQHQMRITGLRTDNLWDPVSGSSVVASANNASGNILSRKQQTENDTTVVGLNYQHIFFDGAWTLDTSVSWSGSSDYWPINRRLNYNAASVREAATANWLDDNGDIMNGPTFTFDDTGLEHWNPDTLPLAQVWFDERTAQNDSYAVQFDIQGDVEFGPIVSVAFGAKWNKNERTSQQTSFNTSLPDGAEEFLADNAEPFPYDDFMERVDDVQGGSWPVPNMDDIFVEYFPDPEIEIDELGTGAAQFESIAGYAMANYEFFDGKILGDFGVRVVETKNWSAGNSGYRFPADADPTQVTVYSEGGNSYTNVLPSINARYVLSEEMLVRFGAAQVMARPKASKLRPGTNIRLQNRSNPTAVGGNPFLEPTVANSYDVSWEWYFQDTAMLSAAAFYKDFKSLTYTKTEEITYPCPAEVTDLTLCALLINVPTTTSTNGDGGFVKGVELAYQQDFSFLPGFMKNFGTVINYTYNDSEATFVDEEQDEGTSELLSGFPMESTSKDTFNGTLYWENKTFSARLAYNYRSERLITPVSRDGSIWADARSTVDFSARYNANKHLSLTLAITNLTDSYDRTYITRLLEEQDPGAGLPPLLTEGNALDGGAPTWRTYGMAHGGRDIRLGLNYKF